MGFVSRAGKRQYGGHRLCDHFVSGAYIYRLPSISRVQEEPQLYIYGGFTQGRGQETLIWPVGTLRYCGPAQFATGQWAGIEMDEADGKNDGSVGGIQYFKCSPKHGIFAPLSKIRRANEPMKTFIRSSSNKTTGPIKSTKIDLSRVTSKINTGRPPFKKNSTFIQSHDESSNSTSSKKGHQNPESSSMGSRTSEQTEFQPGDRVLVVGQRLGTVRFYGKTNFAPGYWCGIELDKAHGKNDGSISGVQYFTCPPKHGVFAPPSRVQR